MGKMSPKGRGEPRLRESGMLKGERESAEGELDVKYVMPIIAQRRRSYVDGHSIAATESGPHSFVNRGGGGGGTGLLGADKFPKPADPRHTYIQHKTPRVT